MVVSDNKGTVYEHSTQSGKKRYTDMVNVKDRVMILRKVCKRLMEFDGETTRKQGLENS